MADFKEGRRWSCLSKQELESIPLFVNLSGKEIEAIKKVLANDSLPEDQLLETWDKLTQIIKDNLGIDLVKPEPSTEVKEAMLRIASQKIPV